MPGVPLERSPLLAELDPDERRKVLTRWRRARFEAGAYLFHAQEGGRNLYYVESGHVAVLSGDAVPDMVMLRVVGPGECFGELALLTPDATRTATVRALQRTETRLLAVEDFAELRRLYPSIDRFLIATLAAEVRRLAALLTEQVELSGSIRVYRRLVALAEQLGVTAPGSVVPVAQHDLAALAGVQLRVTNRALGEARRQGILTTARRTITVLDWQEVRRRAQLPRSSP